MTTEERKMYEELAGKLITTIYDHFPQNCKVDFFEVARASSYAFLCTLSSQLSDHPEHKDKLTPIKITEIVHEVMDLYGHLLAKEGIAEPATTKR